MKTSGKIYLFMQLIIFAIFLLSTNLRAQGSDISRWEAANTEKYFYSPPDEFRAGSWFFWVSGNISEYGIKSGFDALQETGLSSALMIQVGGFGRTPQGPVTVLSDEWYELLDLYFTDAAQKDIDLVFFPHRPFFWSAD